MKCINCGRELNPDSKYCDWCGSRVQEEKSEKENKAGLNTSLLLSGILFSILISLLLTGLAGTLGIPLLFGGLFLPFFWRKKS